MKLSSKIAIVGVCFTAVAAALILGVITAAELPEDALHKATRWILGASLCMAAFWGMIGNFLARWMLQPLARSVLSVRQLADGNLIEPVSPNSADELGGIAHAVAAARLKLSGVMEVIDRTSLSSAGSAEELKVVSLHLGDQAKDATIQFQRLGAASEEVGSNLQIISSSAEEMSASINEISKNLSEAAKVGSDAVRMTSEANDTMANLGRSSVEIGEVTKVITMIAQQTNLLALNATIEAARAGEAGKGFAVVANEVKELAKATAKATEDIGQRVETIQTTMARAVEAIARIGAIIEKINELQQSNAGAVEQQSAAMSEMSRNLTSAAAGSEQFAQSVAGISKIASDSTAAAGDTLHTAGYLANASRTLNLLLGQFKFERQSGKDDHVEMADMIVRSIGAHSMWKDRLQTAVDTKKNQWDIEKTKTDDQCAFGKWFYSLSERDRDYPECEEIRRLHAEFHQSAGNVLNLVENKRIDEARALICHGGRFAACSEQLTLQMIDWNKAVS